VIPVQVLVTCSSIGEDGTRGAFTVIRTSMNTCNSVTIKKLVKVVNTLNFLQKFTALSPVMLYIAVDVNSASYLYNVLYK